MPANQTYQLIGTLRVQMKAATEAEAVKEAEAKVRKLFDQSAKRMQAEITFRPATAATESESPKAAPKATESFWTRLWAALTRPLGTKAL